MRKIFLSAILFFLVSMSFHLCFAVKDTIDVGVIGPDRPIRLWPWI